MLPDNTVYYSGREAPSWGFASVLFRVFFSGRSCYARALCECWGHVPKGSTSFPVPSARQGPNEQEWQAGVHVLCLFYFCTYMCSRFVQYIYTSLLLKWRSISQGPHSNGALFWPDIDLSHLAWQRVHRHHRAWQTFHLPPVSHRGKTIHRPAWQTVEFAVYETK